MRIFKAGLLVGALVTLAPAWAFKTVTMSIPSPSMQKAGAPAGTPATQLVPNHSR